jgi:hypothetical protein
LAGVWQVFDEAVVVPDTFEVVRAVTGSVVEGQTSIATADGALGIRRDVPVAATEPTTAAPS